MEAEMALDMPLDYADLSQAQLFRHLFPQLAFYTYISEMRKALADCSSCLDIGCGENPPSRFLKFDRYLGIDGHAPTIDAAKRKHPQREFEVVRAEDMRTRFEDNAFDCVIALDLIEHLEKSDGIKFIDEISRIAKKKVLLFTPNGFVPQQSHDGDLQEHLSGWDAEEMRSYGFQVLGMHGPKGLRGEYHQHKIKPAMLGGLVSHLGHILYTKRHPEKATAILCVKNLQKENAE